VKCHVNKQDCNSNRYFTVTVNMYKAARKHVVLHIRISGLPIYRWIYKKY